jgi:hypothetical protein
MPWDLLLGMAVTKLNMRPEDFWKLTFAEWFAIYNYAAGKDKPMSVNDAIVLEEAWISGDIRRTGN